jgi:hypothetical protein
MARSRCSGKAHSYLVQKPQGNFLSASSPSDRSASASWPSIVPKFPLCDCYGEVMIPPTPLPHAQSACEGAIQLICQTLYPTAHPRPRRRHRTHRRLPSSGADRLS